VASSGTGRRYALALFDAGVSEEIVEQVHDDVVGFSRLLEVEPSLARFLGSLRVTSEEKKDLIVRAIGERASGLFVKFVLLLIDKKRVDEFAEIADAFVRLYEDHKEIIRVGVVTAVELDAELERKAKATIERRTGKSARIVKRVDPGIIGGMIVLAGDRIIDGSIRSQLGELRRELLQTRVH
jgi:F-type H+-transporting ATPase subunit delta